MKAALTTFGKALKRAAKGRSTRIDLRSPNGNTLATMDAAHWSGGVRAGDHAVLDSCDGPVLDVGCGPGRLVNALHQRGVHALGIDISAEAVSQACGQGARAVLCDVFGSVPASGTWRQVLLVDGNIGIGGDPQRLLRQCAHLAAPDGVVLVELGAPGSGSWRHQVHLHHAGTDSPMFWWAAVAADHVTALASESGWGVLNHWSHSDRWFASLARVTGEVSA